MGTSFDRPLFILGVERSGSTWLANIVDAHPESELYMEPFAPRMEVFPDFPDRLLYLSEANHYLRGHVQTGFDRLEGYKYPLISRRGATPFERRIVYQALFPASDVLTRAAKGLGFDRPLAHVRFQNLNKNRIENPYLHRLSKARRPARSVVKELRLNFKVGLLADLWPSARVLVIVRNPVSQIASILRLVEEGALHELRARLHVVVEYARESRRLEKYEEALDRIDRDDIVHRATAYWFMNYATLLEDLERFDLSHRLIRHEALSKNPHDETQDLLDFAGLTGNGQTEAYLRWSTSSDGKGASVMDTRRDSETYYLNALRSVGEERRHAIQGAAAPFWAHGPAALQEYKSWIAERV